MPEALRETQKTINLGSRGIMVREGVGRNRINVDKEYKVSAGSTEFDVVIDFGSLFAGMAGTIIPPNERWTQYQHGDARILANHDDVNVSQAAISAAKSIANTAKYSSDKDPIGILAYKRVVNALADIEHHEVRQEIDGAMPIVALRAGLPMTRALGFTDSEMVMMDAKRLNSKERPNDLALGLRFIGDKDKLMEKLKRAKGNFLNADPALATGSTQLGILIWLIASGIEVKNFTALSIGASQQGLELLNNSVQQLRERPGQNGFAFNSITAAVHPELTTGEHPYYIKNDVGDFAVGDGGDFLDLLLPGEYRKRWAEIVTPEHILELKRICPEMNWDEVLVPGQTVDLTRMLSIQRTLGDFQKNILVGYIFKKD